MKLVSRKLLDRLCEEYNDEAIPVRQQVLGLLRLPKGRLAKTVIS